MKSRHIIQMYLKDIKNYYLCVPAPAYHIKNIIIINIHIFRIKIIV